MVNTLASIACGVRRAADECLPPERPRVLTRRSNAFCYSDRQSSWSGRVFSVVERRPLLAFTCGAFIVLHGFVHLLYVAQSRRLFELVPGLRWPDGSWAFATMLGNATTRRLAGIACVVAAAAFVAGGVGLLLQQE